ncbi:type III secretion system gatekeeper subunit SctW [Pantoea agglomerans]|uniref:type III secretion system gatekeeper subunit SctW n=1 Tax=Enterobacter agglomerans TaxID=549 RepID=UPI0013B67962|nr:type III secretion system gatekeeper subunit SctW [Pantoea agglomerans]NEG59860.1 YopN family type III secretion system gatekeeper subunit [Pantoea agglomerans]NEG98829.1 YopN family type III secretion system gatekeeper subunit [Pantoea agglomerans]NEH05187.1 YopN family type III secretion system gatekeeper subunit [Pantoea agglomerans]NEH16176.1 YopN family type III secretion system gatekeeper subunit [Pantoea agglomerans]
MAINSLSSMDAMRLNFRGSEASFDQQIENDIDDSKAIINLQQEINDASEEMADMLSTFGRFARAGRKKESSESDYYSSVLEEQADEKLEMLVKQVAKIRDAKQLLNAARSLFPNESDLMLVLKELLRKKELSRLVKEKIKESLNELQKFGDQPKIQSGINVGRTARRFAQLEDGKKLSAQALRESYLLFLGLDIPASYIYNEWIEEYGYSYRKRLLAFTLAALIADMKSYEPGIHFAEFGPLSAKLSDARVLNTLDQSLNMKFAAFPFKEQMRSEQLMINEEAIVNLYISGLLDREKFKNALQAFGHDFMPLLLIKQKAEVIQELRNIYNSTPDFLFMSPEYRDEIIDDISDVLYALHKKEDARKLKIGSDSGNGYKINNLIRHV